MVATNEGTRHENIPVLSVNDITSSTKWTGVYQFERSALRFLGLTLNFDYRPKGPATAKTFARLQVTAGATRVSSDAK
jgi:hypothetical protein